MAKTKLDPIEVEARTAYRAMQKALGILVTIVHPADPDKIVSPLVNAMDNLCRKFPAIDGK